MNAEQVAQIQKEYAANKDIELNGATVKERVIAAALCAQLEKMALMLGISPACLRCAIGDNTTIH